MAIYLKFSPNFQINMGSGASVSAEKIVELGVNILEDFRGLSLSGKMIRVLSIQGQCQKPKDLTSEWQDTIRDYFECMMASQHREVYELLAIYLVLTVVVSVLLIFTVLLVLGKKFNSRKNPKDVSLNEAETGRRKRVG